MLQRLVIQNYILIDSLDVEFPDSLVVISGETGAGKSILIGALSLLLGKKADMSVLSDKSRNCVIEAEFHTPGSGLTILRRVITPQGRSRAFIDDEPCNLDALRERSSALIDIHSQHAVSLLADPRYPRLVLDGFASLGEDVARVGELYTRWQEISRQEETLRETLQRQRQEQDWIDFQYGRLRDAGLRRGELAELEQEMEQLSSAGDIMEVLGRLEGRMEGGDGLLASIKEAESDLSRLSRLIPRFEELHQRIASLRIEIKDIASDISAFGSAFDFSPERLSQVESRITKIYDLMRQQGVSDEDSLIAARDRFASLAESAATGDEALAALSAQKREAETALAEASASLAARRRAAAPGLAARIEEAVRLLEMPKAIFRVEITPERGEFSPHGTDSVRFFFSANGQESLQELSKCASGGEMSRVMLCIKSVMSRWKDMPAIIFDEIDTGVSGSVAHKMGEMVVAMGRERQVFVITHLPQVASRGDAHFLVFKEAAPDGAMRSGIRNIVGRERVLEIARMLSGSTLTQQAVDNAEVLLGN